MGKPNHNIFLDFHYQFGPPPDHYWHGLKHGIWLYAWWKDGVQYVGTSGLTLKEALAEVDRERLEMIKNHFKGVLKITKVE
jgi:hypothetical protein